MINTWSPGASEGTHGSRERSCSLSRFGWDTGTFSFGSHRHGLQCNHSGGMALQVDNQGYFNKTTTEWFPPIFSAFRDREMHNKELWSRIWAKNAQNDISMKKLWTKKMGQWSSFSNHGFSQGHFRSSLLRHQTSWKPFVVGWHEVCIL